MLQHGGQFNQNYKVHSQIIYINVIVYIFSDLLRKAAKALFMNDEFTEEQKHNYFMSVTEREVNKGCINAKNIKDHVIVYKRNINNINLQNSKRASAFIDMVENKVDQEAFNLLTNFRDNLAIKKMDEKGGVVKKYDIDWIGRDGLNPDTHEAYLTDFVNHFYKNVVKMIDRAMKKENVNADSPIVYELLHHLHECKNSSDAFFGRELELRKMKNYIQGQIQEPFFVFGKGGSGKTALLSKTCCLIRSDWSRPGCKPITIVRYCGSTPDSNSVLLLLQSICQQICYNFNLSLDSVPTDLAPTVIYFQDLLKQANEKHPIYIFLDSVDEIATDPDRQTLSWIPRILPPHCKMIVSCTRDETLQAESHDYTHHYNILSKRTENLSLIVELSDLGPKLALEVKKKPYQLF